MYKYKDQKELRMAINGRMITMIAGLFIIMSAITVIFFWIRESPLPWIPVILLSGISS